MPPTPAEVRTSQVPEIDYLFGRWESVDGLTFLDRPYLRRRGFGNELDATRKRGPKVSAKMKVALLLDELDYRRWDSERDPAEGAILHALLLRDGHTEGARAVAADDERAWRAWREKHESEYNTLLGEVDRAIERKKRMRNRWGGWQPVGERKLKRERYERLRAELGDRFIAGTIDREAAVRQWDKRRRDRRKIDPAQAAGE